MQEVFEKILKELDKLSIAKKAVEIVKQIATEYNNGWISIEKKQPEPFDNVFICTKEGGRAIAHRCPNQASERYYDLHSSAIDNVIAWQPLPEPYEQKGE